MYNNNCVVDEKCCVNGPEPNQSLKDAICEITENACKEREMRKEDGQ